MREILIIGLITAASSWAQDSALYVEVQAILAEPEHGCLRCHASPTARLPFPQSEAEWFAEDSKFISLDRDPTKSKIYKALRGNPGGTMPPIRMTALTPLDEVERETIAEWIRNSEL